MFYPFFPTIFCSLFLFLCALSIKEKSLNTYNSNNKTNNLKCLLKCEKWLRVAFFLTVIWSTKKTHKQICIKQQGNNAWKGYYKEKERQRERERQKIREVIVINSFKEKKEGKLKTLLRLLFKCFSLFCFIISSRYNGFFFCFFFLDEMKC